MSSDEETQIFQRMTQAFDAPAFMRRARNVESDWQLLLERCRHERRKLGEMAAIRLARLLALAGVWSRLTGFCTAETVATLQALHAEWSPTLRMPVARASWDSQIARAIEELSQSLERFQTRWLKFVKELDLSAIIARREVYNRYYVLEKECATRSARTARAGFTPLKPITVDDLLREFPASTGPLRKKS